MGSWLSLFGVWRPHKPGRTHLGNMPQIDWGWWGCCALVVTVVSSFTQQGGFGFDLTQQLVFYGAYHSHPYNQAIHLVVVPLIWWSFAVLLEGCSPLTCNMPAWCTWGLVQWVTYSLMNVYIAGLSVGGVTSLIYLALYLSARKLIAKFTIKVGADAKPRTHRGVWMFAVFANALGWWAQVHLGHVVYEGRKPALVDSFGQALVVSPLFIFYETAWKLGLMPALRAEVADGVAQLHQAWASASAVL